MPIMCFSSVYTPRDTGRHEDVVVCVLQLQLLHAMIERDLSGEIIRDNDTIGRRPCTLSTSHSTLLFAICFPDDRLCSDVKAGHRGGGGG